MGTIAVGVVTVSAALYLSYQTLETVSQRLDFGFLVRAAGVEISEGYTLDKVEGTLTWLPFVSSHTNWQALLTGGFNTLKIAIFAIVFSTLLGVAVALGRISTNWLLRQFCFGYVEVIRNTPLLIQLVFWYFAVLLKLPLLADAADLYGFAIASRQGLVFPSFHLDPGLPGLGKSGAFFTLAVAGLMIALGQKKKMAGLTVAWWGALLGATVAVLLLRLEFPKLEAFDTAGGSKLSPEFSALFLALSINTAAFIAEAVRGAIFSLPRGQWEAAGALGLSRRSVQRDIVIPQVFRIVLPSLGNQYISLTKSTSFGIAIGYPDLFNIYGTIANQTGRTVEGILVVILVYVLLSWLISSSVNLLNRRLSARGGSR
ncbi:MULTISPECIES: ABC transporter permease subunit [Variovorax]|uniref:ABC transporter permease subunit n=1 Tax=Variovorax TaxID=34072 RepID=UPI002860EB40|nr:ABC transporter permease subunit [Variovorax sp. 3319]MDR6890991.1 His/Glu/Gln/Arg/opine family amino acid ABC transporter permease subunit [Variovorax sp. 3319]